MQLGIRLHDMADVPFDERLKNAYKQGFTCGHLALTKIPDLPDGTAMLTPGYAMKLKHIFEDAHMDCAALGNYLNLANPDPDELKKIQDRYIAHIRFASLLGCGVVGTETGAPNREYNPIIEETHTEEALHTFIDNLRPVMKACEQFGVILAIEPVYRHIVYDARRARTVLDTIQSPNLRIIFDPVNLIDPAHLEDKDRVIGEAMDLLKDEIAVIHLKDYKFVDDEMISCACGTGEMNYDSIVHFAKYEKPFIQATLENTTPDNAEESRKYIQRLEEEA